MSGSRPARRRLAHRHELLAPGIGVDAQPDTAAGRRGFAIGRRSRRPDEPSARHPRRPAAARRKLFSDMTHPLFDHPLPAETGPAPFRHIPPAPRRPAPLPGQDTREICRKVLGNEQRRNRAVDQRRRAVRRLRHRLIRIAEGFLLCPSTPGHRCWSATASSTTVRTRTRRRKRERTGGPDGRGRTPSRRRHGCSRPSTPSRVVNLFSARYRDPGLLLGQRIGAARPATRYSGIGGNVPQSLVNQACLDIQRGRADVVLVAGAEMWRTRMALRAKGKRLTWTDQDESVPLAQGSDENVPMAGPAEDRIGLDRPAYIYPAVRAGAAHQHGRVARRPPQARSASCGRGSMLLRCTIHMPGFANQLQPKIFGRTARRIG